MTTEVMMEIIVVAVLAHLFVGLFLAARHSYHSLPPVRKKARRK